MRTWIGHIDGRRGLVTWRWQTDKEDGVAVTKGLRIPQEILDGGPEAVESILIDLVKRLTAEMGPGWRIRRVFLEQTPFRDEVVENLARFLLWFGRVSTSHILDAAAANNRPLLR